jgi:invasion protein IalB
MPPFTQISTIPTDMSQTPDENAPAGLGSHLLVLVLGGLGCFVLGAIAAALGLHLWQASHDFRSKVATTAYIQAWQLNCPPTTVAGTGCSLQQAIIQRDTHATVAALTVARGVAADTLQIVVPLGVLIAPGLAVSVGNSTTLAVPYATCAPTGCVAITTLTPKMLGQMENGTSGQITIVGGDGRPVGLPYSLNGFAEAMHERDRDWRSRSGHWF